MINDTIGNYRIISELGYGSAGRVCLAEHTLLGRKVALKLMHHTPLNSSEEHTHFLHEARYLEVLRHPYILPIHDAGIHEGAPYLVYEYAPGGSLRNRLRSLAHQPMPTEEALRILSQIGQALNYAHQQHVIHRDLKPENILFNADGDVLLADFGLAVMLASTSIKEVSNAGTPNYMAPEQFRNTIGRESDQYALACIAYELFTGQRPFTADNLVLLMFKHIYAAPLPPTHHNPQIPAHIERAILKGLAKQRQERHADINVFIAALHTPDISQTTETSTIPETTVPTFLQTLSPTRKGTTLVSTENITQKDRSLTRREPAPTSCIQTTQEEPTLSPSNMTTLLPQHNQKEIATRQIVPQIRHSTTPLEPGVPSNVSKQRLPSGGKLYSQRTWLFIATACIAILSLILGSLAFAPSSPYTTLTGEVSTPLHPSSVTTTIALAHSPSLVSAATHAPSLVPTATSFLSLVPTATPFLSPVPTATPSPSLIPTVTSSPSPVPTATPSSSPTLTPTPIPPLAYEAESPSNTLIGNTSVIGVVSCSSCSGGKKVWHIGNGNALQFNGINVSVSGNYKLTLYYCTNGNRVGYISVNGNQGTAINFAGTDRFSTVGNQTVVVSLKAGNNTIKFYNNNGFAPDLDKIVISA